MENSITHMNILIIEDIPDTQTWLKSACLLAFPEAKITVSPSLKQARYFIHKEQFELCLLDLQLPDGKGSDLLPEINQKQQQCTNIVITIYDDEAHLLPSLKAGAHGYILKDQSKQRIAQMLEQALAGELPLSPKIAKLVLQQFSTPEPETLPISKREIEVLKLVALGNSTPKVAELLNLSKYTVEDHLKNIYRKLEIKNRSEAVLAAKNFGLI